MRKWLLILGFMVIAGGGAVYYFLQSKGAVSTASAAEARSVQASQGNLEVKVSGTGTVAAADTATVKAGYQGTVSKVLVSVGDVVKKGQVLAQFETIDNSLEIRQKQLDKQKQELQIQNLKEQYWSESDESKQAQTKLDLDSARLSLQQTENEIADLQKADAENHDIQAPIGGTVTTVSLTAGDNTNAGADAAVITDYSQLTFAVNADELDVPKLKVGQTAEITLNALTDKTFTGEITSIAKEGVSSNGVAAYPVTLSMTEAAGVLAGMSGSAEIVTESADNAVLVPVDAVVTFGGKSYVRVPQGTEGALATGAGTEGGQGAGSVPGGQSGTGGRNGSGGQWTAEGAGQGGWSGTGAGARAGAAAGVGVGAGAGAGAGSESRMSRMTLGGQLKEVATGLANDTYVQIKSGLSAGDTVLIALPTGTVGGSTGQSSTTRAREFSGMGAGGFGGNMGGAGATRTGGGGTR
ncbi:efflux RND transporter periplasmic adaptor subunit [Paenibacillus sp. D51F]